MQIYVALDAARCCQCPPVIRLAAVAAPPCGVNMKVIKSWNLPCIALQVFARGQDAEHRGLTPGFLNGVRHQDLVRGRSPRHRGVYVGRVARASGSAVVVELSGTPVKRGDGVVFDTGEPEGKEEGEWRARVLELPLCALVADDSKFLLENLLSPYFLELQESGP